MINASRIVKQNIVTLIWQKMSSLITTGTSNGGLDPNHLKSASESSFRWVLFWPLMESIVNSFILEYDPWDIKKYRKCWESDYSKVWDMSNEKYFTISVVVRNWHNKYCSWSIEERGHLERQLSRKQTLFCPKIPNMQYTDTLNESYTYQRRKQFLSIFHSCNNIKVFSWLTLVCSIRPVTSEVIGFPRSYNNPLEDDAYTGRISIEKKKYYSFHS